MSGLLSGSAVSDTTSLKKQIKKYVTPELVEAIAKEHAKNRKLFVVTTHFDAMRPMIWDIGEIASNRGKDAAPLIVKLILASASIPVLFPPVPIERKINDKHFTELHVDGGMTRSVFAYPAQISVKEVDRIQGLNFHRNVYVILNSNNRLPYEPASVDVLSIAERSTNGLLQNQANADIERIYYLAQRDGINFNMIEIPDNFVADGATNFDPTYMKKLLELGMEIGRKGSFWHDKPPAER